MGRPIIHRAIARSRERAGILPTPIPEEPVKTEAAPVVKKKRAIHQVVDSVIVKGKRGKNDKTVNSRQ